MTCLQYLYHFCCCRCIPSSDDPIYLLEEFDGGSDQPNPLELRRMFSSQHGGSVTDIEKNEFQTALTALERVITCPDHSADREDILEAVGDVLRAIPDETRGVLLSSLFNSRRKHLKRRRKLSKRSKQAPLPETTEELNPALLLAMESLPRKAQSVSIVLFLASLVNALDQERAAKHLGSVLRDLPPGCLGDLEARDRTRVFLNVTQDVRSSQIEAKRRVREWSERLETAGKAIQRALGFSSDGTSARVGEDAHGRTAQVFTESETSNILAALLNSIETPEGRERVVLQQFLLCSSYVLPPQYEQRSAVVSYLFPAIERRTTMTTPKKAKRNVALS